MMRGGNVTAEEAYPRPTTTVDVPVNTFREFVKLIARHDLWDEVTEALRAEGMESVTIARRPIEIISGLVSQWGSSQAEREEASLPVVVPECGCNVVVTHPDIHPHTPEHPHGDGGTGDAGHPH